MVRSRQSGKKAGDGVIRLLWPTERDLFREHLLRLDPVTRHQRFGTAVNDAFLENYARTTFGVGGLVYAFVVDGVVRGAAELRGLDDIIALTGEAAFSVEAPWRRRGVGSQLFSRLITAAREIMICNRAIRNLIREYDPNAFVTVKEHTDVYGNYLQKL